MEVQPAIDTHNSPIDKKVGLVPYMGDQVVGGSVHWATNIPQNTDRKNQGPGDLVKRDDLPECSSRNILGPGDRLILWLRRIRARGTYA